MDILISWSKAQSKNVASALHKWLPKVVPGINPWMSSKDIAKGREWFRELQNVLSRMQMCIICVTPENVRSPWIYYETGAIATKGTDVLIYPYLVGVSPSMLTDGPLGNWQCTIAERNDTYELIKSLNENALASNHDPSILESNFDLLWLEFEIQIKLIKEADIDDGEGFVATEADLLAGKNLSSEARKIIIEVSKDNNGMLMYLISSGGTSFLAGGKDLCPDQSPRTVSKWKSALDHLVVLGILEPRGYKGEIFALTTIGFDIADILQNKDEQNM